MKIENYFISTSAPTSSSWVLRASASSFDTPSLIALGAASTSSFDSLRPKLVIGFAAETNNIIENAEAKISKKHCDWIIANDISKSEIGFDSDFNEVSIIYKDKNKKNELISKRNKSDIAVEITKRILENFNT